MVRGSRAGLHFGNNKYFLNTKTGVLYKGWQKSSKYRRDILIPKQELCLRGLRKSEETTIISNLLQDTRVSGFVRFSKTVVRYFSLGTYTMATGWMKNSKGQKWYFRPSDGVMYRGLKKIGSYYYYFDGSTGATKSGFLTAANGNVRYFASRLTEWRRDGSRTVKAVAIIFAKNTGVMCTRDLRVLMAKILL